jgi:NDP-sugar pyrophosphorylase family protein
LDCIDIYKAAAVVATKEYEIVNPYGVVEIEENKIVAFKEKPISRSNINTGIYAIKPEILNFLQKGEYCDMPDLLSRAVSGNKIVAAYPMYEPWLDVGRPSDLKIAKAAYAARSGDDY